MSKQSIKATIDAQIKQNGAQAITGQVMNSVLNQMVDNLAEEASTTEKLSELDVTLNGGNKPLSAIWENGFIYNGGASTNASFQRAELSLSKGQTITFKGGKDTSLDVYALAKKVDSSYTKIQSYSQNATQETITYTAPSDMTIVISSGKTFTDGVISEVIDGEIPTINEKLSNLGEVYFGSGTTTATAYSLVIPVSFSAGESIVVESEISELTMKYILRVHCTDNTFIVLSADIRGHSYHNVILPKDVDYVEAVNNASAVAGLSISVKVYSGVIANADVLQKKVDNNDNTTGWKLPSDFFEIANIVITTNGWNYNDSAQRVRLGQGRTIHLAPGDVIGLTDYTNRQFYIGGLIDGTTYITHGWVSEDYTIVQEGEYTILCSYVTAQNVTSVTEFSDYVFVIKKGGLLDKLSSEDRFFETTIEYNKNVKSVAHRGYIESLTNPICPENTLSAFRLAKRKGYTYVETDIKRTSDGHYILLHDFTIDRTSNGTGSVLSMTLAQLRQYSFGYINGNPIPGYTNEIIPTLNEFLTLCHRLGLHPYIEIEFSITSEQCAEVLSIVKECGMYGKVTFVSQESQGALQKLNALDDSLRIGVLQPASTTSLSESVIAFANSLKGKNNEIFIDANDYSSDAVSLCIAAGYPLEIYTIDGPAQALSLPAYVTGITTNKLNFGKILYNEAINP